MLFPAGRFTLPDHVPVPAPNVIVAPLLALEIALLICDVVLSAVQVHDAPDPLQVAVALDVQHTIIAARAREAKYTFDILMRVILSPEEQRRFPCDRRAGHSIVGTAIRARAS
jgi:hypothetical protein